MPSDVKPSFELQAVDDVKVECTSPALVRESRRVEKVTSPRNDRYNGTSTLWPGGLRLNRLADGLLASSPKFTTVALRLIFVIS